MKKNYMIPENGKNKVEIIDSDHLAIAASGDCMGKPFEYMEQCIDEENLYLKNFSSKYIREPLPDPDKDKDLYEFNSINNSKIKNVYKFGFMLLDSKDYVWKRDNDAKGKDFGCSVETNFINADNQTTDDTKFMMDGAATIIKHESKYNLTQDKENYTFVSEEKKFATLTDDYTNEIFTNVPIDKPQAGNEYGGSMLDLIQAVNAQKNKNNNKEDYATVFNACCKKKQNEKGHWGKSYGNGAIFRPPITSLAAQSYEQGLKLTDMMVKNTHDAYESIRGARAVYTVSALANYGLQAETIRKIIHFMFYDKQSQGDGWGNQRYLCNYDMLSHRKNKNIKNNDQESIKKLDREQLEQDIKGYKYSERTCVTATMAIRIALTAESPEEAKGYFLEAGGDCDTLGLCVMDMSSKLHGCIKSDVEKMKRIFLKTKYDKNAIQEQIEKEKSDKDAITRIDEKGNFVYYTNLNNKFNEMFKHHTRANSKIQWQLLNIFRFMEYIIKDKEKSEVENKDQLLNEIFQDIRADIDFMLDRNKQHQTEEINNDEIDNLQSISDQIKSLTSEQTKKIMENMEKDKNYHDEEIKKLKNEYEKKIRIHKYATVCFQNKIKNDKLQNLDENDIKNIKIELSKINDIFGEQNVNRIEVDNYNLKAKHIENDLEIIKKEDDEIDNESDNGIDINNIQRNIKQNVNDIDNKNNYSSTPN